MPTPSRQGQRPRLSQLAVASTPGPTHTRGVGGPRSAAADTAIRQLQSEVNAWLIRCNTRRRKHSEYTAGRTPAEVLDSHTHQQSA